MAKVDPSDQQELNKLVEEYIKLSQKVLGINSQQAQQRAEAAKQQGTLNKEVERMNDELNDMLFKSDSLAQSFRESLAELKNQNVVLQQGRAAFKGLTDIAQDLSYFQRGITDLSEKDLKKKEESLGKSVAQLKFTQQQLSTSTGEYNRQSQLNALLNLKRNSADGLTKSQQSLLDNLIKEKELLEATNDALKDGVESLNQELQISKQISKTTENLGGITKAAGETISKFGGSLSNYLNISDATEAAKKYNQGLIDSALKSENVLKQIKSIEDERIAALNNSLVIQGQINDLENQIKEAIDAKNQAMILGNQLAEIQRKIASGEAEDLAEFNALLDEEINLRNQINTLNNKHNQLADLEIKKQEKINELNEDELKTKQKLADLDKKEAKVKEDAIKSVDTYGNKFKSLGVFAKEAASGLTKAFTDPAIVLTTLIELGFKADRQVTELGKSLGVSKDVAGGMRADMAEFAALSGDAFLNTDRLMQAQAGLSQELGMAVKFSNEELATFSKLTELTGLSAQEAGKLAGSAAAAGMSTEAYTDSLREGAFSAMQATKTHFSTKEIMQDVSKLSAGILTKFQGNPKAIGQAVVEAKKLGSSLEQIDKIGDSLLNWESSIENELKAELMTGKQLNLERARAAALSGDQLTLTREISSQVGTSADFSKMNVLAQKSLAEAFGMSREEMADMLMKQEAINKYGDKAAELNKEQLADMERQGLSADEYLQKQEQQRAAQDKFKDAMVKLQGLIANLVDGPVGQLLDALANMVGFAMKLLTPLGYLIKPISWIGGLLTKMLDSTPGLITAFTILGVMLLPKIASGLGSMMGSIGNIGKGIQGLGKGIKSAFSGEGVKGFFGKVKEGFKGGVKGGDKGKDLAGKATEKAESSGKSSDKAGQGSDGSKFKTKMQNIADGIKAFADKNVLKGAINLIPASIGLVLFIPGALGAKVVEIVNGEKFQKAMEGIANGIKAFGNNVTLGSLGKLLLGGAALDLFAIGVPGMLLLQIVNGDKFQKAMTGIGTGIADFGKKASFGAIAKLALGGIALDLFALGVPGLLLLQLVNGTLIEKTLGGIGKGIAAFSQNVSWGELVKAAVAIALLGASLIPAAYAFKMFAEVSWEDLAKAGVTLIGLGIAGSILGGMAGELLMGAIAIAALGASLIPAAYALQMFAEIKWSDLAKAGVALLGLGVAGAVFGALSPLMFTGAAAIAALGLSLIPFGIALRIITPAIEKFGNAFKTALDGVADIVTAVGNAIKTALDGVSGVITAVGNSVTEIINAVNNADVGKIFAMGPALLSLAAGLAALGAGGVVKSATGFISGAVDSLGNLIGITDEADTGGPVSLLNNIATSAEKVVAASEGLKSLTDTLNSLNSIDTSNLSNIPPILEKIGNSMVSLGAGSILSGIGNMLGGGVVEMLKGIGESGEGVERTANAAKNLTSIDTNALDALVPALKNVGDSMLSLSAASLLLNAGGGPAETLKVISESGIGIQKSASALQMMAGALTQVASALDKVDVDKLSKINSNNKGISGVTTTGGGPSFTSLLNPFSAISSMVDLASGLFSGNTEITTPPPPTPITTPVTTTSITTEGTKPAGSIQPSMDLSPMIAAIKEVKTAVDRLYTKDQSIHMDGKKVGTTLTQGSHKVA